MNESIKRRYRQERAKGLPALSAYQIVRWVESEPKYDFLSDLDLDKPATGTVGPFDVRVYVAYDEDSRLGEDDVTGMFSADTERPGPEWIKNASTGWTAGRDARWYRPCTYALSGQYYRDGQNAGMSKSVAREFERASIRRDMLNDGDRSYYGVHATISVDGHELAGSSLWGIDHIGDDDSERYMRDAAAEQIDQAIDEAWRMLPAVIRGLGALSDRLAAVLEARESDG